MEYAFTPTDLPLPPRALLPRGDECTTRARPSAPGVFCGKDAAILAVSVKGKEVLRVVGAHMAPTCVGWEDEMACVIIPHVEALPTALHLAKAPELQPSLAFCCSTALLTTWLQEEPPVEAVKPHQAKSDPVAAREVEVAEGLSRAVREMVVDWV
jgi:hypothetical protein